MSHIISVLFGSGTWGAGGNIVAYFICLVPTSIAWVWHHRRTLRRELAALERRLKGTDDDDAVR